MPAFTDGIGIKRPLMGPQNIEVMFKKGIDATPVKRG